MYLPFCGISISNAKLFSESRKEYERSRVRAVHLHQKMFGYLIINNFRINSDITIFIPI